jgi:hypothetical protein
MWPLRNRKRRIIIWEDPSGLSNFSLRNSSRKKGEAEPTVYFKVTVTKTPGSVFYIEGADDIDRMRGLNPRGIILDEYVQIKRGAMDRGFVPATTNP